MQPFLLNPGIPILNLFKNPVTGILVSKKRIDFRRIPTLIKGCFVPFYFSLIVKQSIFRTAGLMDFNNHFYGFSEN
jgi:hypothetical protein